MEADVPEQGPAQPDSLPVPTRSTGRVLALLGGVLLACAAFGLAAWAVFRPLAVEVVPVREGTVRGEIHAPGTVQARVPVAISSKLTGTLTRVLVDVGDLVTKGQLLATIEDADLLAKLESGRAAARAAAENVAAAEAALDKARADLELALANHGRSSELVKKEYVSRSEHDASTAALRVAEAGEVSARKVIAARRAEQARAEQEQRVLTAELSYARIQAPMDGIVTRRLLEPGTVVVPSSPILQVVDPASLWVATLVDESLVGHVRVGQSATIHLRSGASVTGKVGRVTLQSDPVTRELEVDVTFDVRATRFSINEEADVTILGEPDTGLAVPLAALARRGSKDGVFVVRAGRVAFAPVRLGVSDRSSARALEGVEEGQTIVVSPGQIKQGQRIRPIER